MLAPRFGYAYDLTGTQSVVLRGGAGIFYDRPDGNSMFGQITNPPTSQSVTVNNGELDQPDRRPAGVGALRA